MEPKAAVLLFLGSIVAGVVNALAGGGAFITLPLLIAFGVPPTIANMTGSVATWPGMAFSAWGYRRSLETSKHHLWKICLIAAFWSLIGSILIMKSSDRFFARLIPYLLFGATLFFIYGTWFVKRAPRDQAGPMSWGTIIALSAIGLYGGYWGGGMGIMTLSLLTISGWTDIHEMNAVKMLSMTIINGVGLVLFIWGGFVSWPHAAAVCAGAAIGGYFGSRYIRGISTGKLKAGIAVYAVVMSVIFFFKT